MLIHENSHETWKLINDKLEKLAFDEKDANADEPFEIIDVDNKETQDVSTETEISQLNLDETIRRYEEENRQLTSKCADLENCIELLRNEYEKCEDYWASKLDEERQMFDQEQTQNTEKLNELITKMTEYEEQFAMQDTVDNRLPPVEEKYDLEKQFTDLEQEYEDYKEQTEIQMEEKNKEIEMLKQKLTELALQRKLTAESAVQVDIKNKCDTSTYWKMSNLSNHVVESTNLFSADAMPLNWTVDCQEVPQNDSLTVSVNVSQTQRDYVNPAFLWNKETRLDAAAVATSKDCDSGSNVKSFGTNNSSPNTSLQFNTSWQSIQSMEQAIEPSTSANAMEKTSTPCRPKRTRKYDRNSLLTQRLYKKTGLERDSCCRSQSCKDSHEEQTCILPISTMHNLHGRLHHLEQRCRHLQTVLKQQHYYAEHMLQRKYIFLYAKLSFQ